MQSMNVQMLAFEAHHLLTPVPAWSFHIESIGFSASTTAPKEL